ncbi:MAG: acid phosphatase [Acidimicrobiales bacterium]|nr:acid phosphatase [Acidimicrobiales bacterium]
MLKRSGPALVGVILMVAGLTGCDPAPPSAAAPCGRTSAPVAKYDHVMVVMEENRTWSGGATPGVGAGFDAPKMPFLHGLATKCSWFSSWNEINASQNSLNQYIGLTSGVSNPSTVNDCLPSDTCHSTDNNIFRQVRTAGGTARVYVDGATTACSAGTNAAKHIPAMYYWGGSDKAACAHEVLPLSSMNPNALPTYGMVVPDLCHDGHDCPDTTVDTWAKTTVTRILDGASYKAGRTLVVVVYDEDHPVPNLLIAPTAHAGVIRTPTGSHAALLKTIEQMLGLPVMDQGQLPGAISLRSPAHL